MASIGPTTARLVSVRAVVDLAVEWIETHRVEVHEDSFTPHPDTPARLGNPRAATAIVSVRATERQRVSGQRRPAWPGNAMTRPQPAR